MSGFKSRLIEKFGLNGYKGILTAALIASVVFMVFGWRNIQPPHLYYLGPMVQKIALLMLVVAIYLIVNSTEKNRLNRIVRHPQLTGLIIWAVAHVLMNGDTRAVTLFSGLALWAIVEIIVINRRDGFWQKPAAGTMAVEIKSVVKAIVVVAVLTWAHPYFAGVPVHG